MGAYQGLQRAQTALEERGVRDVKFFFRLGVSETPRSDVRTGVASFLDAYINGRFVRLERLGDSPRK